MNIDDLIASLGDDINLENFDFERCYKEVKPGGLTVLKANIAHYLMRYNIVANSREIDEIEKILRKVMSDEHR